MKISEAVRSRLQGMLDKQLGKLTEVLKLGRIWAVNVGENFNVTLPAWQ